MARAQMKTVRTLRMKPVREKKAGHMMKELVAQRMTPVREMMAEHMRKAPASMMRPVL